MLEPRYHAAVCGGLAGAAARTAWLAGWLDFAENVAARVCPPARPYRLIPWLIRACLSLPVVKIDRRFFLSVSPALREPRDPVNVCHANAQLLEPCWTSTGNLFCDRPAARLSLKHGRVPAICG